MLVEKFKSIGKDGHFLEIGKATWDPTDTSIRNRYPTKSGGFNVRSSSEIPLHDIKEIVHFVAEQSCLPPVVCIEMAQALLASAKSQLDKSNSADNPAI